MIHNFRKSEKFRSKTAKNKNNLFETMENDKELEMKAKNYNFLDTRYQLNKFYWKTDEYFHKSQPINCSLDLILIKLSSNIV